MRSSLVQSLGRGAQLLRGSRLSAAYRLSFVEDGGDERRSDAQACSSSSYAAVPAPSTSSSSLTYPSHPRVGVGAVVFRISPRGTPREPQVLLVKRGKEPDKGMWSFPGGSLELGETLVKCAEREVLEETGIRIVASSQQQQRQFWSSSLSLPTAFAASDAIYHEGSKADNKIKFHYSIIQVAALASDPLQEPVPSDDAEDAMWLNTRELGQLSGLTDGCDQLTREALRIFDVKTLLQCDGTGA